jgi:predicted glutamine amidotransferase
MMAARAPTGADLTDLLLRFRKQAQKSATGPETERHHLDGWGIVAFGIAGERLFVRRPTDVTTDDAYEAAVRTISGFDEPLVIVHFRNASIGEHTKENTHPFGYDGWWFAHNGTIKDAKKLELRGVTYEGETDSERYFRKLVRSLRIDAPSRALPATAQHIAANCAFSSLTSILTDGSNLFAYRCLGGDLEDCGTTECQLEYYTLGVGHQGNAAFIAQETTHLGKVTDWKEIPVGSVVEWSRGSPPRIVAGASLAVQPTSRRR